MFVKDEVKIKSIPRLSARSLSEVVKYSILFDCEITIEKDGIHANAKSLMSLLSIDFNYEEVITIKANGDDSFEAVKTLKDKIESYVDEK